MNRALLTIPFGVVALGACHKDPPAPVAAVVDAAPPPSASTPDSIVDASPAFDAAAATVDAGAISDALLAGSSALKVLVPKEVGEGAGDPLDALTRTINRAVAAGKPYAGAEARVVLYVDNTSDYGCVCPPWVFAPFWNSGHDGYFYPTFAAGVPEAPIVKQGIMRFAGHFDGKKITGFEWLKSRHEKPDPEGTDEFAKKAPVFVVEGWCFEPAAEYTSADIEKVYAKELGKMQTDGRLCPGTHLPKHATE